MSLTTLSLLFLQLVIAHSQSHSFQNVFLNRISPQYEGNVFGGSLIDNHIYNRPGGKVSVQVPALQPDFTVHPQVASPIQFNGQYSGVVATNGG